LTGLPRRNLPPSTADRLRISRGSKFDAAARVKLRLPGDLQR
jgi:hypothetical protein